MTDITNNSRATLITNTNSDICVVNAARVSFSKESSYDEAGNLTPGDQKLLNYLASHAHWTPFSHVRETFAFDVDTFEMDWFIQAVTQENLAGIVIAQGTISDKPMWVIRHSVYGWIQLLLVDETEHIFQPSSRDLIINALNIKYPGTMLAYQMNADINEIGSNTYACHVTDINSVSFYDENRLDYFIDFTIREEVPIYVARQRFKHMVGFTYNEVSRRYVDTPPEYYIPDLFRGRAENKKQGSLDTECNLHDDVKETFTSIINSIDDVYLSWVDKDGEYNVCPEQARSLLPQAMMTSYYVTGNKTAWKRFITQRLDPHAQKEIRDLALVVSEALSGNIDD